MMRKLIFFSIGCALFAGCIQRPPNAAPTMLALRGEGNVLAHSMLGYSAGASIAAEAVDCCGIGTFISYASLPDDGNTQGASLKVRHDLYGDRYVSSILTGGIELSASVPYAPLRDFTLRIRGGLAGTAPSTMSYGRRGFGGSVAAMYRIKWHPPEVGGASPELDVVFGTSFWSLGANETAAGSDDSSAAGAAVMLGVQLGADYGVDLR